MFFLRILQVHVYYKYMEKIQLFFFNQTIILYFNNNLYMMCYLEDTIICLGLNL